MLPRPSRLLLPALLAAAVVACNRTEPAPDSADEAAAPAAERTLNVYMWSDYIDPKMVAEFEQRFGVRVAIDTYEDSEAMQARMQLQGGDRQYDLLVVSDYKVPDLAALELIQPLDLSHVPNAGNVMDRFRNPPYDPEGRFSLPYQWGTVGIMYRKDRLPGFEPTWAHFFDASRREALDGPFLLIDEPRDTFAAAFKFLGHSVNTTDPAIIKQAGDLILAAKSSEKCLGFQGGAAARDQVAQGSATLAIVYSGDAFKAMAEEGGENLGYAIPAEGGEWWIDAMVLPAHAKDADLAYAFINYILDPQFGGDLAEWNQYGTPNQAALQYLPPETRANEAIYPSEDVMNKLEPLKDIGDARQVYDEVWTAIKAR